MKICIKLVFGKIYFEITTKGAILTWTIEGYRISDFVFTKIGLFIIFLLEITIIPKVFFMS